MASLENKVNALVFGSPKQDFLFPFILHENVSLNVFFVIL